MSRLCVVAWFLGHSLVAAAEPDAQESRFFAEGGLVVARSSGSLSDAPRSYGEGVTVGVRLAPHLSAIVSYRNLLEYTVYLPPVDFNGAPITFHCAEVLAGLRYTRPILPHLFGFGEAQLAFDRTTISDEDFAGGDDESQIDTGLGVRAGVIGELDTTIGAALGVGVAVSYERISFGRDTCRSFDHPCLDSWRSLDVFARVSF